MTPTQASLRKAETEELLRLLKQRRIDTRGHAIETFLSHRGDPPGEPESAKAKQSYTLGTLRDHWLASATAKRLEPSTFQVVTYQWRHLIRILGSRQAIEDIRPIDLQRYIDRRVKDRDPPIQAETIKKEIKTLKYSWKWAQRMDGLTVEFPGNYLVYPKTDEQYPYMTLEEAARVIAGGADEDKVYESIYLTPPEVAEVLAIVRARKLPRWVATMFIFAAHTGARRSEMVRAHTSDVDLAQQALTVRERKRIRGKRSTRRVPLTPLLADTLRPLLDHPGPLIRGSSGHGRAKKKESILATSTTRYFHDALRGSRYSVLRGWHVFRHSYISALAAAGVDQRIIDDLVGHSTEEQRRRYRHLLPNLKAQAVLDVFGGGAILPPPT